MQNGENTSRRVGFLPVAIYAVPSLKLIRNLFVAFSDGIVSASYLGFDRFARSTLGFIVRRLWRQKPGASSGDKNVALHMLERSKICFSLCYRIT